MQTSISKQRFKLMVEQFHHINTAKMIMKITIITRLTLMLDKVSLNNYLQQTTTILPIHREDMKKFK